MFSPLYGLITWLRNILFDVGFFKEHRFNIPVITIGNLNVGGTGKTPHTIHIAELLHDKNIAVLSRGYGRKSTGFQLAQTPLDANKIGDEPAEIKLSLPSTTVAVDEKRVHGIQELQLHSPDLEAVILDDAFQHRHVKPTFSILLTAFDDLFTNDWMLPAGNLREFSTGKKRANMVIVTKCPSSLSNEEQLKITKELKLLPSQELFFSSIQYQEIKPKNGITLTKEESFLLVTGIAHPQYMVNYLKDKGYTFESLTFKDHHNFRDADYQLIKKRCDDLQVKKIVTTVKDAMRLNEQHDALDGIEVYKLPIGIEILNDQEKFKKLIFSTVS